LNQLSDGRALKTNRTARDGWGWWPERGLNKHHSGAARSIRRDKAHPAVNLGPDSDGWASGAEACESDPSSVMAEDLRVHKKRRLGSRNQTIEKGNWEGISPGRSRGGRKGRGSFVIGANVVDDGRRERRRWRWSAQITEAWNNSAREDDWRRTSFCSGSWSLEGNEAALLRRGSGGNLRVSKTMRQEEGVWRRCRGGEGG
jgi:hypothetical protein